MELSASGGLHKEYFSYHHNTILGKFINLHVSKENEREKHHEKIKIIDNDDFSTYCYHKQYGKWGVCKGRGSVYGRSCHGISDEQYSTVQIGRTKYIEGGEKDAASLERFSSINCANKNCILEQFLEKWLTLVKNCIKVVSKVRNI